MKASSRMARSTALACAVLAAAGCSSSAASSNAAGAPGDSRGGPTSVTSGSGGTSTTQAGSGTGTVSAATTAPNAVPATMPPASARPSGAAGSCLGTLSVVYPASDNPLRSACVHLGAPVNVELLAIRGVTWTAVTPSDPGVAAVTDQVADGGTRHDSVRLLRTGTVVLESTASGSGPRGSGPQTWTLTLTVVP